MDGVSSCSKVIGCSSMQPHLQSFGNRFLSQIFCLRALVWQLDKPKKTHTLTPNLQLAIRNLQFSICNLQFAFRNLQLAIYHWKFAIKNWQLAICNLQLATCNLHNTSGGLVWRQTPDDKWKSGYSELCAAIVIRDRY